MVGLGISVPQNCLLVQLSHAATVETQGEVMGVQLSLRVLGDALICPASAVLMALSTELVLYLAAAAFAIALLLFRREERNQNQLR